MRELMVYPPFCFMVRMLVSDFRPEGLLEQLEEAARQITRQYPQLELLGPAEAPISMVAAAAPVSSDFKRIKSGPGAGSRRIWTKSHEFIKKE